MLGTSCSHGWKRYTVQAGKHSNGRLGKLLLGSDMISFEFIADSSWYYSSALPPGWSKIRGISHGHHQNNSSARLGYQCLHDSVLIVGAYCYIDGVSPQENQQIQKGIIDTIQPGITYHCNIYRKDDFYHVDFQDKTWLCPAGKDLAWGYRLNPYIGGEFTLDHDWNVMIKDL